jgi:nuclear migration protein JNM1
MGPDLQLYLLPQATTLRTDSDHDDAGFNSDIDREGVNADQARLHFMGAAVDARDANFSDSISSKRQAYRSKDKSNRRRRRREDGTEEVGDLSDSEDESVERRLARLRREVEDLKLEMENRSSSGPNQAPETDASQAASAAESSGDNNLGDGVAELSRALDNLHALSRGGQAASYSAATALTHKINTGSQSFSVPGADSQKQQPPTGESASTAVTPVPAQTAVASAGLLSHAAAFEGRLALLEASMGISSSSNPFVGDGISEPALQPVLPALEQMTSRISALSGLLAGANPASGGPSAVPGLTTPHLESLSTRVRKLTTDAEALASARKRAADAAKAAQAARVATGSDADGVPSAEGSFMDDEQIAKIQALYATLPTIQSLHPLLPSVLERLRSLRACHAGAAHAAESLNELEKRHAEMASEIEQWREGLTAVEEKMKQGEAALRSNVETVEPWVRDLESRMARLGGPPGGL